MEAEQHDGRALSRVEGGDGAGLTDEGAGAEQSEGATPWGYLKMLEKRKTDSGVYIKKKKKGLYRDAQRDCILEMNFK